MQIVQATGVAMPTPATSATVRREDGVPLPGGDAFSRGGVPVDPSAALRDLADPMRRTKNGPVIGQAEPAPRYAAGTLRSPKFLGTEAEYFKEARRIIEDARPGDLLCAQMYEFQNAETNGDRGAARNAPGYADQQALLPGFAAAAARGVKVHLVLDASSDAGGKLNNQPILDYLKGSAKTGNLTVDLYPPDSVNIDHAKMLIHMAPDNAGKFLVDEMLGGGSNWGNHTPANDDGGGAFYGRDAVGAADIFFRDQAFARGDHSAPAIPQSAPDAPVQWAVTAPPDEGGGSSGIKETKVRLSKSADAVYVNQYGLTNRDVVAELIAKGRNAHVRLCPTEHNVNSKALTDIRRARGEALWADTTLDPDHMPGQKNHEKLDIYVKQGVPFAMAIGSANDTANGLEGGGAMAWDGPSGAWRKSNHEVDAFVYRTTTGEATPEGTYSTAPFLDAALAKTKDDLAHRSTRDLPERLEPTLAPNPEV